MRLIAAASCKSLSCSCSGVLGTKGMSRGSSCRVYVGGLPQDARSSDIEDIFHRFGRIVDVDLKNRRPGPPFAFVEFEDPR